MKEFYASVSETGLTLLSRDTGKPIEVLPIVQAGPEHRNFILSTWVRSYEPHARRLRFANMPVTQDTYRSGESAVAEANWTKSHVVVSEGDTYTIHAWVCAEPGKLWHVYVPPGLRLKGIARGLVEQFAGRQYAVSKPWPTVPKGHVVTFNPYLNGVVNAKI